jgi:hypothetical protein
MADPAKIYVDAVSAAKKALGKDGELPKPRVDVLKTIQETTKSILALNKNREEMEKTLIDVATAVAKTKAAAKQYGDLCDGFNYELTAKDADTKKTVAMVTKIMLDGLQSIEEIMDEWSGFMDKLDKGLTDFRRLK